MDGFLDAVGEGMEQSSVERGDGSRMGGQAASQTCESCGAIGGHLNTCTEVGAGATAEIALSHSLMCTSF
jgi:hypothetical protein